MFEVPKFDQEQRPSSVAGERIDHGIWRPGILDSFSEDVAAAASTKELREGGDIALRLLGDVNRFDRPMGERIRAARILAELRNAIDPDVDLHNIVKTRLTHSGNVEKIDEEFVEDLIKGNLHNKQIAQTDGMITNLTGYPLYVSAADCNPVGIFDPKNKAIGAFHNGIYGLMNRISENGLQAMVEEYGTDASEVKVVIGPGVSNRFTALRSDLAEYGEKYPDVTIDAYMQDTDDPDMVAIDLGGAIKASLMSRGVLEGNIELSDYHTDIDNQLFSSELIEGGQDRGSIGFMMTLIPSDETL